MYKKIDNFFAFTAVPYLYVLVTKNYNKLYFQID